MGYPNDLEPNFGDGPVKAIKAIWAILWGAYTGDNPLTVTGGGGGGGAANYVATTPAQLTVGTSSSVASAASTDFRKVAIYNNSGAVLTFAIGATPVSDTGTIEAPNYDGYGTQIFPGGYYEMPEPCKQVVNIIASAASSKATVIVFTQV